MRRTPINPAEAKSGDLIVTSDNERMRVKHVTRVADDTVIVHGDTVNGAVSKAQSQDVTRLD